MSNLMTTSTYCPVCGTWYATPEQAAQCAADDQRQIALGGLTADEVAELTGGKEMHEH